MSRFFFNPLFSHICKSEATMELEGFFILVWCLLLKSLINSSLTIHKPCITRTSQYCHLVHSQATHMHLNGLLFITGMIIQLLASRSC